jgi:SAM-dependent methyltransferase
MADGHVRETQAFFGPKAGAWDQRFPDDGDAFAAAVAALGLRFGDVAVDVGCGTGRALGYLRDAVGDAGAVIGVDVTPEMLQHATARHAGPVVLGDARRLPLRDGGVTAVLAAGLVPHLPDPGAGLAELARVTSSGGRIGVFHPIGRAALAARHGHGLAPDDPLAEPNIRPLMDAAGWQVVRFDDTDERYLCLAERRSRVQD